jgi:ATP-binding cassette subfamily F protein 3
VGGAQQRKLDAQARQALLEKTRPLKKELEQVDKRMALLSAEKAALEHGLAQPMAPAEIAQNGKRLKAATDEIATLEERWLELSSALEALAGG